MPDATGVPVARGGTGACRLCGSELSVPLVDLGSTPLANSYIHPQDAQEAELFYPLMPYVCGDCFLVQLPPVTTRENIFGDYAYFSSFSNSWLHHCASYADLAAQRFGLEASHRVVEVASNDGYLLQYFAQRSIPVLGIEPAANVAAVAKERGIPTLVEFFGTPLATRLVSEGLTADLLIANNVLAHVPDLHDFLEGIRLVLGESGVATVEFPHVGRMIEDVQFDTIYHEHLCYFSLGAVERACRAHGLEVFDVDVLPTHGGSLRLFCCHKGSRPIDGRVTALRRQEQEQGLEVMTTYQTFQQRVREVKRDLLSTLIDAQRCGMRVVGYGAPAKATTLLNFCGIRTDMIEYTVDRSPHKQGLLLPGSRIPICDPSRIAETRPDLMLLLAWNLREEVLEQISYARDWGAQFVVPIPTVEIVRPWKSRLGVFYVEHRSVSVDLQVIWLTALCMVSRKRALRGVQRLLRRLGASQDLIEVAGRELEGDIRLRGEAGHRLPTGAVGVSGSGARAESGPGPEAGGWKRGGC